MERAWLSHVKLAVFAALGAGCNARQAPEHESEQAGDQGADADRGRVVDAAPEVGARRDLGDTPDLGLEPDGGRLPDTGQRPDTGGAPDVGGVPDLGTVPDIGPPLMGCEDPVELRNSTGGPTGYVRCEAGGLNRVGPAACDGPPRGPACNWRTGDGIDPWSCRADTDCTEQPFGRCIDYFWYCGCRYGCVADGDCGVGEICVCDEEGTQCVAAGCRSGDDCDFGQCGLADYDDGCANVYTGSSCRMPLDECYSGLDCDEFYGICGPFDPLADGFQCQHGGICGRPLYVRHTPILAPPAGRPDWARATELPSLHLLDATDRAALTRHWLALAALEHASVASFARFTLQLMALGAPADLVAAAQQAGLDEVRHAQLCYGVAGLLNGAPVGPAALDLRAVTLDFDPETVLREVVREACIGETLGAAEAFELADLALDPALARLWRGIAEDELRHATLGWATLRWLLSTHPNLAPMAAAALSDLGSVLQVARGGAHLPRFGLLGPQATHALRLRTLRAVVAPAAAAALGA